MKHQVFFFLSIFSFSVFSMNYKEVHRITNAQIADALSLYCSVYPDLIDHKNASSYIQQIRTSAPLSFELKIAILNGMREFPQPHDVCVIGNKAFLLKRENYEINKLNDDTVY